MLVQAYQTLYEYLNTFNKYILITSTINNLIICKFDSSPLNLYQIKVSHYFLSLDNRQKFPYYFIKGLNQNVTYQEQKFCFINGKCRKSKQIAGYQV